MQKVIELGWAPRPVRLTHLFLKPQMSIML